MSYNYYFCSIPKEKLEEYKNIPEDEDKIEIFSENEIMLLGSIPEIGKYWIKVEILELEVI